MAIEFFINRVRGGYQLEANGQDAGTFGTVEAAADMAVRFAQDAAADAGAFVAYKVFYP